MSNTVKKNLSSLIAFNQIIEKTLSMVSNQVKQDYLAEFLLDMAWEKNLFIKQLKKEVVNLEGLSSNLITLNKFSDFIEFDTNVVNRNASDLKHLENVLLSVAALSTNYEMGITINNLTGSSMLLLKFQQKRIVHGLALMQNYYNQNNSFEYPIPHLIA